MATAFSHNHVGFVEFQFSRHDLFSVPLSNGQLIVFIEHDVWRDAEIASVLIGHVNCLGVPVIEQDQVSVLLYDYKLATQTEGSVIASRQQDAYRDQ